MGSLEVNEGGKKIDPTSMPVVDPIIGMNLSSSQTELVQSWGWVILDDGLGGGREVGRLEFPK